MQTVDVAGLPVGDGHPPRIMGVLNMSVESNYAPSTWGDVEHAVAHAEEMTREGADIIDVGLQSSNPKNPWKAKEIELDRLERALDVLDATEFDPDLDPKWSIETRYAEVADEALSRGFDLVNDVCGFADPEMPGVCEAHDAAVVKMASPPDLKSPGHLQTIDDCFAALERGGFTDKTIIDPAFGGWYDEKTYEHNWEMFRRLREFRAFDRPILTATNREDFLGDVAGRPETEDQLAVSLAAATMEVERGAHVVRTHDVPETKDVVAVAHFLGDDRVTAEGSKTAELTGVSAREVARNVGLRPRNEVDPGAASTLSFQTAGLGPGLTETLARIGESHGVLVATGTTAEPPAVDAGGRGSHPAGAGTFVSGTVAAFEAAVPELADVDGLEELTGAVRRALSRQ
jgi:dihydropteroate synthase